MGKPADFGGILNGVMWFQVAFASVFIALRLYTRQYIIRNTGWDDVLMIVNLVRSSCNILLLLQQSTSSHPPFSLRVPSLTTSQATFIGYVGCVSVGVTYGVGKKTADIVEMKLDYSKSIMWEAIGQGICIMGIVSVGV